MWIGRTRTRALGGLALAAAIALGASMRACAPGPLVLGTFNIEMFPHEQTDRAAVVDALVELDATVIALQEIRDPFALQAVLWLASERLGRDYRVLMAPCGGNGVVIATALVWDASRVRLVDQRGFPGLDSSGESGCRLDVQPALLGIFERPGGERFGALTVHMNAFPHGFDARKRQWGHVVTILERTRAELSIPVVALGDFNSTGLRGQPSQERPFIDDIVRETGLKMPTRELACTEYWRPQGASGPFAPSLLDHALATDGAWTAETLGMCARLSCKPRPARSMDPAWRHVSDHCPVRVTGRDL